MSDIDWNQAPAEATHYAPAHGSFRALWAKWMDGEYWFFNESGNSWYEGAQPIYGEQFIERPKSGANAMTDVLEVSNNIRGLNVESAEAQLRRLAVIQKKLENWPLGFNNFLVHNTLCEERDAILAKWLD